jgi:iron complex outermembrane receptor protein
MVKSALLCGGSALAVAMSLYGSQVLAADATASAADTAPSVGELVVVAEKREQSIESVPVAITAFTPQQRSLMGIQIVQDLADFSPSLNWTDIDDRIYIRGIGRNSDNLNNTSGVALYFNGIYYGANASIEQQKDDLFIGNIEVDNGPQNTLHGSNADGGVVEFTSQKPTDTPYAEIRTGVANYGNEFVEGVVSGPINDHLKFRLGGNFTEERGGFFNNYDGAAQGGNLVLGGSGETHYLEGQLEGHWDHLDAWVQASTGDFIANTHGAATIGNYPDSHSTNANTLTPNDFYGLCGLPGVIGSIGGAGCAGGPSIVPGSVKTLAATGNEFPGNNPGNLNPRNFLEEMNGINSMQGDLQVSAHVTYHLPSADISYLAGYQQFHYVLAVPDQYAGSLGAGVTSWQEAGESAAAYAGSSCALAGYSAAACEAPLTVSPTPNFLTFDEFDQSFSHELDITSTDNSPFQYVAGLYWYNERYNQPVDQYSNTDQLQMATPEYYNALGATCADGALATCAAPANPTFAGSSENTAVTYNSYAAFAQGSYKFNDQWKASGAFRYTQDDQSGYQTWRVISFDQIVQSNGAGFLDGWGSATPALDITALAACGTAPPNPCTTGYPGASITKINPATGNAQRKLGVDTGAPTGEFDLDWTPDSSTLAYFKYSRGYKKGGWSTYTIGPNPTVDPEYVDAFEVGAKRTVGRELTMNGDVFYYNYYGEQTPLATYNPVSGVTPVLINIPQVRNYGLELWGTWRPIDPLAISLSYSYLSATVQQSPCFVDQTDPLAVQAGANTKGCLAGSGLQNIVGQTVPGATPNKISVNGLYTFDFEPGKLTLSGTFIWRDGTYDSVFNRAYNFQPASTQVNLRATWASADGRYNVIGFIDNVFNTIGYDGAAGVLLGENAAATTVAGKEDILGVPFLNAPRTFGIQFQYRWK